MARKARAALYFGKGFISCGYPKQANELIKLLDADQKEYKAFSREYYWNSQSLDGTAIKAKAIFKKHVHARAKRMLEIIEEISEPSLTNIGEEAAQAISILATHSSLDNTRKALTAFESCYARNPEDTFYQAIPIMTDWVRVLERKLQRFGTMWLFDKNKYPYLPPVEDFEHVNERCTKYDLEPLRWPKSLAIPEERQPWLKRPLSELVMRKPTDSEYVELTADFM